MPAVCESTYIMRIHRDIFPDTDHGYTWVECYWFEREGKKISPTIPGAGCTARLGGMPGGPIVSKPWDECKHYCGADAPHVPMVRSEEEHKGFHRVGPVCIYQP